MEAIAARVTKEFGRRRAMSPVSNWFHKTESCFPHLTQAPTSMCGWATDYAGNIRS